MLEGLVLGQEFWDTILGPLAPFEIELSISAQLLNRQTLPI